MNQSHNIKIHQPYTLDDLKGIWESGWEDFANVCLELGFRRNTCTMSDDKSKNHLIQDLMDEIIDTYVLEKRTLQSHMGLNLLYNELYPRRESSTKKSKGLPPGRKAWEKIRVTFLKAFLETLIGTRNINSAYQSAIEAVLPKTKKAPVWLNEYIGRVQQEVPRQWIPAFELLLKAINDEITEPEAFWHCAWMFTEIELEDLKDIEAMIRSDTPLTEEQFDTLNQYIGYGYPRGYWVAESGGKKSYEIHLEVEEYWVNMHDLSKVATMVLVQPAFQIAQVLQQKTAKARYTLICRAPSCNKAFYTGRQDATACPGSQGSKKNKCALEWIRFKRYLEKIGSDPEQDWHKEANQAAFLKYDKS